jgi:hypothetical protein
MTAPSLSLSEQMLRRRPVFGAPVAHGASDHLKRTISTFQLTMFGVGATVGTGIFIVLPASTHNGAPRQPQVGIVNSSAARTPPAPPLSFLEIRGRSDLVSAETRP